MKDGLENIDEVFKQAFDGFEANVDPSVWTNIQSGLNVGANNGTTQADPTSAVTGSVAKSAIIKIAATVIAVGTIATASYYIVNSDEEKEKVVAENVINEAPIESEVFLEEKTEEVLPQEETSILKEESFEDNNITIGEATKEEKGSLPVVEMNNNNSVTENTTSSTNDNGESNSSELPVNSQNGQSSESTNNDKVVVAKKETTKQPDSETPNKQPVVEEPKTPVKKVAVVNDIPKAFSPNGDGQNDVIKIEGENLQKMELIIMDKTGKLVYKLTNIEQEWDGKDMNGFDLIPGTYYMAGVVVDKDGNTKNIKQAINLFK